MYQKLSFWVSESILHVQNSPTNSLIWRSICGIQLKGTKNHRHADVDIRVQDGRSKHEWKQNMKEVSGGRMHESWAER